MLGVLDRVLGHYQLSAPTGIEIGPGRGRAGLHPDDAIYPVARPHAELVVNVMWPLDDFTEANGATRIVPRQPPLGRRAPDRPTSRSASVEMPAGLGTDLPRQHVARRRREPNRRTAARRGHRTTPSAWLRPVENHVLAVPPEVARDLPERLQELLGYNIGPPFIGYVDGRHPKRLLGA